MKRPKAKSRTIKDSLKPQKIDPQDVKSALESVHVMPSRKGKYSASNWRVRSADPKPLSRGFRTKEGAVRFATKVGASSKKSVVIHDRKGRVVYKGHVK